MNRPFAQALTQGPEMDGAVRKIDKDAMGSVTFAERSQSGVVRDWRPRFCETKPIRVVLDCRLRFCETKPIRGGPGLAPAVLRNEANPGAINIQFSEELWSHGGTSKFVRSHGPVLERSCNSCFFCFRAVSAG